MLKSIELLHFVEAFPTSLRSVAAQAAEQLARDLAQNQWPERIELLVGGEKILVPARVRFLDNTRVPEPRDDAALMVCAIHSRSFDGYQRQAAARALLPALQDWSAPFMLFLMGEWIAEILEDMDAGLTEEGVRVLARCAAENPAFWQTTKSRVQSYFHVYQTRIYKRADYPGFRLIARVEAV